MKMFLDSSEVFGFSLEISILPIITCPFIYVSNTVTTMDSLEEALIHKYCLTIPQN